MDMIISVQHTLHCNHKNIQARLITTMLLIKKLFSCFNTCRTCLVHTTADSVGKALRQNALLTHIQQKAVGSY